MQSLDLKEQAEYNITLCRSIIHTGTRRNRQCNIHIEENSLYLSYRISMWKIVNFGVSITYTQQSTITDLREEGPTCIDSHHQIISMSRQDGNIDCSSDLYTHALCIYMHCTIYNVRVYHNTCTSSLVCQQYQSSE